jgi:hypothetical protein
VLAVCFCDAGEMLDKLVGTLPPPKDMETVDGKEKPLAIAIVGRPNVGECIRSAFDVCMHAAQESMCWNAHIAQLSAIVKLPTLDMCVELRSTKSSFSWVACSSNALHKGFKFS